MKNCCKDCKNRDFPRCQTSGECAAWIAFQEWNRVCNENRRKEAINRGNYFGVMRNRTVNADKERKRGVRLK